MLSIYMTPEAFGSADAFAAEVRAYLDFVATARPAEADGTLLLPGEPERIAREKRSVEGVPLSDDVWQSLRGAGRRHGIDADAYRGTAAGSR